MPLKLKPDRERNIRAVIAIGIFGALLFLLVRSGMITEQLQTSTLRTTTSKFNSTPVFFTIPEKGRLLIEAGPTKYLSGASIFALAIESQQAVPVSGAKPFSIDPALTPISNLINPEQKEQVVLSVLFPKNYFSTKKKIAELSFGTKQAGEFVMTNLYFGSLPTDSFPPSQDYAIYVESSNILFNEQGLGIVPSAPSVSPRIEPKQVEPTKALALFLPVQYLKSVQNAGGKTNTIVLAPPAQEQMRYEFTLKATGGELASGASYVFGAQGRSPNVNDAYPLQNSGLVLKSSGLIFGEPGSGVLKPGNYRYPLFVTDGKTTLPFALQIAVNTALGTPVQLRIETGITGAEHRCEINKPCEAFFQAKNGIPPYQFSFAGKSPTDTPLLQMSTDPTQAFYRFTPTESHTGSYKITISLRDSSIAATTVPVVSTAPAAGQSTASPTVPPKALTIQNFQFSENSITVPKGTKVTWSNADAFQHTVSSTLPLGILSSPVLEKDQKYEYTFQNEGTFQYQCTVHPGMTGTVKVQAPSSLQTSVLSGASEPISSTASSSPQASLEFTLVIARPELPPPVSTFKPAAEEKNCEFLDVSRTETSYQYFQFTCQNAIMEGTNGMMRGRESLNRAESAKITTLITSSLEKAAAVFAPFANTPPETPVNFQDVTVGDWYGSYVYYLFQEGIIANKPLYRPADSLTAAEALKLVIEAYAALSEDVVKELENLQGIGEWYQPYQTIAQYVDASIGRADPGKPVERQQIAELLYKLWKAYPVGKFK